MESKTLQLVEKQHSCFFEHIIIGKQNVTLRQTIIHELTGIKPTKAKSGITIIRGLLKKYYAKQLSNSCWAVNQKELRVIILGWDIAD